MQKYLTLTDNNKIPLLGLGTWKASSHQVGDAVRFAIATAGYKHIDCASIYANEKEIGEVFKEVIGKSIKREELFVTSKLWNTEHRKEHVEKACRQTLSDLKLEYLDLYLMHWGVAFPHGNESQSLDENGSAILDAVSIQETWNAMEQLVKKGLVKSIGVANFTAPMLVDLLAYANVAPVMNQIELHPYNTQTDLVDFCHEKKIAVTAYSPLGRQGMTRSAGEGPRVADDSLIKKIAAKYHKSPSQILLQWAIGRGTVAIPKSITPARIRENIDIFDFALTTEEQAEISSLNRNYRFVNPNEWWKIPYFS